MNGNNQAIILPLTIALVRALNKISFTENSFELIFDKLNTIENFLESQKKMTR